jgi:hypothetical protein
MERAYNLRMAARKLSKADVVRLLARLGRQRRSIVSAHGDPDPAFERALKGGKIANNRIQLALDKAVLPAVTEDLLTALGHEAHRWLGVKGVDTLGYSIGLLNPWFMLDGAAARARAEAVIAELRTTRRSRADRAASPRRTERPRGSRSPSRSRRSGRARSRSGA